MREKIKAFSSRAKAAATAAGHSIQSKAHQLADLNGDGKVDSEDARIAAERAGKLATDCGKEAARISKEAIKTDLGKNTAAGAAVGAAVGTAVPLVGTAVGGIIGAGVGAYKGLTTPKAQTPVQPASSLNEELMNLDELRQRGILTDEEFQERKHALLLRHPV
jgi:phage tail tape-measure protein